MYTYYTLVLILAFLFILISPGFFYGLIVVTILTVAQIILSFRGMFKPRKFVLRTIALSHYVEKVRFLMDFLQIEYQEKVDVAILGVMLTGRTVPVLTYGLTSIGDSEDIVTFLRGFYPQEKILDNSYSGHRALVEKLDLLGKHCRRVAYYYIIQDKESVAECWSKGAPQWQAFLFKNFAVQFSISSLKYVLQIDEKGMRNSREKLNEIFKFIDNLLSDGRPFLCGQELNYLDFAFAALSGPMILHPSYGGKYKGVLPTLPFVEKRFPELYKDIAEKRDTLSGKHAIMIFDKYRFQTKESMKKKD